MKFLCLIYSDERQWATMPRAAYDAVLGEFLAFTQDIRREGKYLAGEDLEPTSRATTVRVRNGRISVTDGPFAETKEQLGGFYLIEAGDLDDAVRTASRIPSARYGTIEVRPIQDDYRAALPH
jgi:hypothetical protein